LTTKSFNQTGGDISEGVRGLDAATTLPPRAIVVIAPLIVDKNPAEFKTVVARESVADSEESESGCNPGPVLEIKVSAVRREKEKNIPTDATIVIKRSIVRRKCCGFTVKSPAKRLSRRDVEDY